MTSGSEVRSIAAATPARCAASAAASPAAPAFNTLLREMPFLVRFMAVSSSPMESVGLEPFAVPVLSLLVIEIVPDHGAVHHGELGIDVLDVFIGHRGGIEVARAEHHQVGLLAELDRAERRLFLGEPSVARGIETHRFRTAELLAVIDENPPGVLPRNGVVDVQ